MSDSMDTLVGRLAAEGELEEAGGFSIDPEKAREKMRQFQLPDPRRYVLLLVQAAVHQGAQRIRFQIDTADMQMMFDGAPFSRTDIDELYVALFGNRADPRTRARQELAVALNAAMALNPRWIRFRSVDTEKEVVAELKPGEPDSVDEVAASALEDRFVTSIHVRDRFRPGLVMQFFRNLSGTIAEEKLLREYCRYAQTPIELDGSMISGGMRVDDPALGRVDFEEKGMHGVAGFVVGAVDDEGAAILSEASVGLLNAGVWVAAHRLPKLDLGFRAMFDATALRRDVSGLDVVRDEAYEEMLDAVGRAAERSLLAVAQGFEQTPPAHVDFARSVLRQAIAKRGILPTKGSQLRQTLNAQRVWPTLGGAWVSATSFIDDEVEYVGQWDPREEVPKSWHDVLDARDPTIRRALQKACGNASKDRSERLRRFVDREAKRRRFLSRTHDCALPEGLYHQRAMFERGGFRGEVGLRGVGGQVSSVAILKDGCLLETIQLDRKEFPVSGLVAVVEGPFDASVDWDRTHRTFRLADALLCVLEVADGLFEKDAEDMVGMLLERWHRQRFLGYLQQRIGRNARRAMLKAAGFKTGPAKKHIAKATAKVPPRLEVSGAGASALLGLPLFEFENGSAASVADVDEAFDEDIRIVSTKRGVLNESPTRFVRVGGWGQTLLEGVFGEKRVKKGGREFERILRDQKWLDRPKVELELPDRTCVPALAFEHNARPGLVGLRALDGRAPLQRAKMTVNVLRLGRALSRGVYRLPSPFVGVLGAIEVGNAPLDDAGRNLRGDKAERILASTVLVGVSELFERACTNAAADIGADVIVAKPLRGVLLRGLEGVFADPDWGRGWLATRRVESPQLADERLVEVVKAFDHLGGDMRRSLINDIFAGEPFGLNPGTRRKSEDGTAPFAPFRRTVIERLEQLCQMPLFRSVSGPMTLNQLAAAYEEDDEMLVVPEASAPRDRIEPPKLVLVVNTYERSLLARIFGKNALADGQQWLTHWRNLQQLVAKEPLTSVTLDPTAMLVTVDLTAEGVEGQVGVPNQTPTLSELGWVQVCSRRRPLCQITPKLGAPLRAIISGEYGRSSGYTQIDEVERSDIESIVAREMPALAQALARAFLEAPTAPPLMYGWIVALLGSVAGGTRGDGRRMNPEAAELASLEVFATADGSYVSLVDLGFAFKRDKVIDYLNAGSAVATPPGHPVVVLSRAIDFSVLESVFGKLRDYAVVDAKRRDARARVAASEDEPTPPLWAVATLDFKGRGLEGTLWLGRDDLDSATLALCRDGKVCERIGVSTTYPCWGVVRGKTLRFADDWSGVEVKSRHRQYLRERARALYRNLGDRFEEEGQGGQTAVRDDGFSLPMAQRLLRDATLRLHRMQSDKKKGRNDILLRKFAKLPLFELNSGRQISLQQAILEQPFELAHLELWEPSFEDDPAELVANLIDPAELIAPEPVEASPLESPPAEAEKPNKKKKPEKPKVVEKKPPTRGELLIEAVRAELRNVRRPNAALLADRYLDRLTLGRLSDDVLTDEAHGNVVLNGHHPVGQALLDGHGDFDPALVSLVASSAYTTINRWLVEVTDEDEALFLRLHVEHLATGVEM